jgi:hypothetical protein
MTRARAAWPAVVVLVVTAFLTGGCGAEPDLDADRASQLQEAVLQVSTAAAASQWDAADAGLVEARARLDAGVDAGEVSTARYREIDRALDAVAAAVAAERARVAAEQAAAAQAAAEQAAADQAAAEQAAAEQAAADQAAAEQAAAVKEAKKGPADRPGPDPAPAKEKGPAKPKH